MVMGEFETSLFQTLALGKPPVNYSLCSCVEGLEKQGLVGKNVKCLPQAQSLNPYSTWWRYFGSHGTFKEVGA